MTGHLKVSGTWKNLASVHCKVGGEWKNISSGWRKDSGTWKQIYSSTSPVYSIIYNKNLASDPSGCLTYAGLCEGFTPMGIVGGGIQDIDEHDWAEGNGTIFDAIEVGYLNGTNWVAQDKNSLSHVSSYNAFTRIPKIYQKVTELDTNIVQLDISLEPFKGATLHPAFIKDGVEKNHKYIGRYLGYVNSSKLESKSGKSPTVSTTRATFRTYAKNNGTGYGLLSYYDWDLVNKLFLFAFKTFNSQNVLGYGRVNASSKANTGGSPGNSWMYSTADEFPAAVTGNPWDSATQIRFLGIEDWWGNLSQFIDDFYGTSNAYYAGSNSTPTDNANNKNYIGSFAGTSGTYPLKVKAGLNNFFISEATGGSTSTGICDYQFWDSGENLGFVGGHWSSGSGAGAFCLRAYHSLSTSGSGLGARLTYCD